MLGDADKPPPKTPADLVSPPLADARLVLVGRFAVSRRQLTAALRTAGATVSRQVTTETTAIIVGIRHWALQRCGRVSRNLLVGHLLKQRYQQPRILSELEFLTELPWLAQTLESVTVPEPQTVESAADERPREERPNDEVPRTVPFSEWQQARMIADWLTAGVSPRQIDRALHELSRWIPEARRHWEQLPLRWHDRKLRLRGENGQWREPAGQLLLDLDSLDAPKDCAALESSLTLRLPREQDSFGIAVRYEAEGNDMAAEATYREILLREGPDPDVCFNLANVLVRRGQRRGALERLWICVEISPSFVEAWYNLGLIAAELGEFALARRAFHKALEFSPEFQAAQEALNCLMKLTEQLYEPEASATDIRG